MTINQGRGRDLPRGGLRGRGTHDILSGFRGGGQFQGVPPLTGINYLPRGVGRAHPRGGLFARVQREQQRQLDLEASAQQTPPTLAPVRGGTSTGLEQRNGSIYQPLTPCPPLRSNIEYVKSMPFGLENTDMNPLQGLGRVFDPHHGGDDMYIYSKFLIKRSPVVVSFADDINKPILYDTSGQSTNNRKAYGSLYEHYNNDFFSMLLLPATQYPSMILYMKRENYKTASFQVFPNSLKLLNNIPNLKSYSGNDVRLDRLDIERNRFTLDFYKRPNIGQIVLNLLPQGTSNNNPSLEDRQPIWAGDITKQEILNMVAEYKKASALGALSTFSKSDAVIARLYIDTNITISLALEGYDNHRYFDESMIHFENCLQMCSTFGNLWFYTQLAEQYGPADDKRSWADAPRPYWLAIEWAIERNENGEIIKATPSKWSKLRHPGELPDERTAALMIELHGLNLFD
jgi:hypothetical protein